MVNINRMLLFATVVESESFSEAARRLGIGKSAVSMQVNRLEQELGVKLLNRTSRHFSLTEAGKYYFQSCAHIAEEVNRANEQIKNLKQEVSGVLRVTCPVGFGNKVIVPAVKDFMDLYSDVEMELDLSDQYIITPKGRIKVNNETARLNLVLHDYGLSLMPIYDAWNAIKEGKLVQLFKDFDLPCVPVSVLYLDRRFLPKKIPAFVEFMKNYLRQQPWVEATQ